MNKRFFVIFLVALLVLPLAIVGCKGKVAKESEEVKVESTDMSMPTDQSAAMTPVTEPAQAIATTDTIPPTAAAPQVTTPPALSSMAAKAFTNEDIQRALKSAGFYTGSIDGKIGPKTKAAIVEFQKSKGLNADGKVGPKTWAELAKYLIAKQ